MISGQPVRLPFFYDAEQAFQVHNSITVYQLWLQISAHPVSRIITNSELLLVSRWLYIQAFLRLIKNKG